MLESVRGRAAPSDDFKTFQAHIRQLINDAERKRPKWKNAIAAAKNKDPNTIRVTLNPITYG